MYITDTEKKFLEEEIRHQGRRHAIIRAAVWDFCKEIGRLTGCRHVVWRNGPGGYTLILDRDEDRPVSGLALVRFKAFNRWYGGWVANAKCACPEMEWSDDTR